ncbi:MAG: hypothetical protein HUJ24_09020 [Rhodobacteraceae bacterium]|nr:hypothetical protein [Paracoccaceae bacterium]
MAAPAQVTWAAAAGNGAEIVAIDGIRKSLFGTSRWRLPASDAIACMELDEWRFFVEIDGKQEWLDGCQADDGDKVISADGAVSVLL